MQNVLQRNMFQNNSPKVSAEGVGITDGLMEDEKVASAEALGQVAEGMDKVFGDIDAAENPKGIMDALRGNNMSIEERKAELAELVGEADAKKTPESVLTLIQPTLTILEMAEKQSKGEGGITDAMSMGNETPIQAPGTEEAVMRMASGEKPVGFAHGGYHSPPATVDPRLARIKQLQSLVPNALTYEDYMKKYKKQPSAYEQYGEMLPGMTLAKIGAQIANTGKGESLVGSLLDPEFMKGITDPIQQLALMKGKETAAQQTAASTKALESAQTEAENKAKILTSSASSFVPAEKKDIGQFTGADGITYTYNKGLVGTDKLTITPMGGGKPSDFKTINLPDGSVHVMDMNNPFKKGPNNVDIANTTQIQKGKKEYISQMTDQGLVLVNKNNPNDRTFVPGTTKNKEYIKMGTAETGIYAINKNNPNDFVQVIAGTGPEKPETVQLMQELQRNRGVMNTIKDKNSEAYTTAVERVEILTGKLIPKGTELQEAIKQKTDILRTKLNQGEFADPKRTELLISQYKESVLNDYILKSTTTTTQYNPRLSIQTAVAKLVAKDMERIKLNAGRGIQLSDLSKIALEASGSFTTGALADTRLGIKKISDLFNITDTIKSTLVATGSFSEDQVNSFFSGRVVSGEIINAVGAQFAVLMAGNFPGNLNQSEVDLIKAAGPNLSTTKEGLEFLTGMFKRAAERSTLVQNETNAFLKEAAKKGLSSEDIYVGISEIETRSFEKIPLVTAKLLEPVTNANNQTVPEGGGQFYNSQNKSVILGPDRVNQFNIVDQSNTFEEFVQNGGASQLQTELEKDGKKILNPTETLKRLFNNFKGLSSTRRNN